MNMHTTTRLDDRFNAFLIAVTLAAGIGMNVSTVQGAALGRDGALAQAVVKTPAATAPMAVVRVAAR